MRVTSLPYFADSATLFTAWANKPGAVFLDSGYPNCLQGRYDIISAEPYCTLSTQNQITTIAHVDERPRTSKEDPFSLLRKALGPALPPNDALPFCGGAIGYFAYDLARRTEKLPDHGAIPENIPEMFVGIYDWVIIVDHLLQKTCLVSPERHPTTATRWPELIRKFSKPPVTEPEKDHFHILAPVSANMSQIAYTTAFERIQHYIKEGDCYQVNLAQRFSAPCSGSPWHFYNALRLSNPAPFSAYLNTPTTQILSSSPERFLKVSSNGQVETKPIKGTRPRSVNLQEDAKLATQLANSEKDRAENLMIVDLLRNDISKHCNPGSVKVPSLFQIETFATVHHMVSTVTGTLEPGHDALHLLRDSFPGGSITGAPKIRAMQIIEELEPNRRGAYCGALGYISFDGKMDTNIAIRSLVHENGHLRCWAGGGIVADSAAELEYAECFHKAAAMLDLFQAFLDPSYAGNDYLGS